MPRLHTWRKALAAIVGAALMVGPIRGSVLPERKTLEASLVRTHLLVALYGNPHSPAMGVLGQRSGDPRAPALRAQAQAYAPLTNKRVLPAYHSSPLWHTRGQVRMASGGDVNRTT